MYHLFHCFHDPWHINGFLLLLFNVSLSYACDSSWNNLCFISSLITQQIWKQNMFLIKMVPAVAHTVAVSRALLIAYTKPCWCISDKTVLIKKKTKQKKHHDFTVLEHLDVCELP